MRQLRDLSHEESIELLKQHGIVSIPEGCLFFECKIKGIDLMEVRAAEDLQDCGIFAPKIRLRSIVTTLAYYREYGVPIRSSTFNSTGANASIVQLLSPPTPVSSSAAVASGSELGTEQLFQNIDDLKSRTKNIVEDFLQYSLALPQTGVNDSLPNEGACRQFREKGINATILRNPDHRKLPLLGRKDTINKPLSEIPEVCVVPDKAKLITIPAGPGQGKSEIAARMVENWDTYVHEYNQSFPTMQVGENTWLVSATTFNLKSDVISDIEDLKKCGLLTKFRPEHEYELLISFRLMYTWLVKEYVYKDGFDSFITNLIEKLHSMESERLDVALFESLRLQTVTSAMKFHSGRSKVVVIVDESLLPLQMMDLSEDIQRRVISAITQLQTKDLVVVFTILRQSPFLPPEVAVSGRKVESIVLKSLNLQESEDLIDKILPLYGGSNATFSEYNEVEKFKKHVCGVLARWSGGRPRLCQIAAFVIARGNTRDITELINLMNESFRKLYPTQLPFPREAVVFALLGAQLPSTVSCNNETVDRLIAYGLLSRADNNQLRQPPLLLRFLLESKFPTLIAKDVVDTVPRSQPPNPDEELAREIGSLMNCISPSVEELQFENIDRLNFRVLKLARHQFLTDVANGSLTMTTKIEDRVINACSYDSERNVLICPAGVNFRMAEVNWKCATLEDYFDPFRYSKLNNTLKMGALICQFPTLRRISYSKNCLFLVLVLNIYPADSLFPKTKVI